MRISKKTLIYDIIIPIIIVLVSVAFAIIFNDYIWGLSTLIFGFLNAYYMANGKWYNYIFGILFSITYAIVCYFNGLFGFAIFTILAYTPIQMIGLIKWFKKTEDKTVKVRSLSVGWGILISLGVVALSAGVGFLLTLIPGQNLAFLDSASQMINLAGIFLLTFRFRESWYVWLANNTIDLAIWIINTVKNTQSAPMMLVLSVMYLAMNVYGLIAWIIIERKQKLIKQTEKDNDDKNSEKIETKI